LLALIACGEVEEEAGIDFVPDTQSISPVVRAAGRAVVEHDLARLQLCSWGYLKKFGRYPRSLDELVWTYLRSMPAHPSGGRYLYDPSSGVVFSSWGIRGTDVVDSVALFGQIAENDSMKFVWRARRDTMRSTMGDSLFDATFAADTALDIEYIDEPESDSLLTPP
jgi:hypothetical protein